MYSLFVSANSSEWEGEPFMLELGRCAREYTDDELTARFGEFSSEQVDELRRMPCVFAYEDYCAKDPKFGVIRDVTKRQGKVRITYDIIPLDKFLTASDLNGDTAFLLDIHHFEMNRTHWAVKGVDLARELHKKGIDLPHWARLTMKAIDVATHQFDVALSFPGEVRDYVEQVAAGLERDIGPDSYFYDGNYVAQLARPSLDDLLQDIYSRRSKLVVVFVSADYQKKDWCGIEFRAVKEIIMKREHERVMYVKMGDGEVDGMLKTDGYVDGQASSPADVARFIQQRVELLRKR